ncbi:hypothetical protein MPL1_13048 [Methylophaga lonarensis MPL]|uniref:Uncharacterized protein n=1 Tax=Methylophaga lonarensis MPL TaxID=1286106 RepID=M7NX96_9GAMM|nr:hypothetical protein MPL1_13048 [Methylophaga lonarensis MPL]
MHAHSPNNPRAPPVLACGFTALLACSGVRPKLAALEHWPPVIQTKLRYSSTQKGMFELASTANKAQQKPSFQLMQERIHKRPYAKPSIAELVGSA